MKLRFFRILETAAVLLTILSCNGSRDKNIKNNERIKNLFDSNKKTSIDTSLGKNVWYFEKISGQTLYFKNGKTFKTNLYDLHYIGQLQSKRKAPFFILSGRGCDQCDANTSIYIHSPSDGPMKNEAEQARYSYPGKVFDYSNNKLIFDSRMFYGNCSIKDTDCVVWIQRELNDNGLYDYKTFIVKVDNDTLKESIMKVDSLRLIKPSIKCNELAGKDATSEP